KETHNIEAATEENFRIRRETVRQQNEQEPIVNRRTIASSVDSTRAEQSEEPVSVTSTQSTAVGLRSEISFLISSFLAFSFSIASDKVAISVEQPIITPLIAHSIKVLRACIYSWNLQAETFTRLPVFITCCAKGKISLLPMQEFLPSLDILLTNSDSSACLFRQHIRMYNSALAFTSMGMKIDHNITETANVYNFRIHSEMYHTIGSLLLDNPSPQFAQLYVYDTEHELQNRMSIMPNLDSIILAELQQILHNMNPYCRIFRQVGNMHKLDLSLDLKMLIINNRRQDPRRYNIPTTSEVAVIMIDDRQTDKLLNHDIIVPYSSSLIQEFIENKD
ncbi:20_t:CDS:2, partial [Cetraspora pellucida]